MKREDQNSILIADDANDPVAGTLSSLKRVEPPGDFDFQLKARIARSKPRQVRRTGMLLVAKFTLPMVVLAAFGAFFILSSGNETTTADAQPVVDSQTQSQQVAGVEPKEQPAGPPNNELLDSNTQALQRVPSSNRNSNLQQQPGGGSTVESLKPADDPIYPPGINPKARIESGNVASDSQFAVFDLLSMLGMSGEFTAAGYSVSVVSANSIAARAGVRSGDVVEAIDDRVINARTVFRGAFTGKVLRVVRDGRRMNLNLAS